VTDEKGKVGRKKEKQCLNGWNMTL
jgi:hypothetical protein